MAGTAETQKETEKAPPEEIETVFSEPSICRETVITRKIKGKPLTYQGFPIIILA